ncbi:MAG: bacillithiol system redox-active protein YtxJ [Bacteroidetes bacterium]|nr:bacillithiol system redox-active protein YtxJ [Bacteroidota bacterium]
MLPGRQAGSHLPADWQILKDPAGLEQLIHASFTRPQLVFKHSTRCSISFMAMRRLAEGTPQLAGYADIHYLDLIAHREVSNAVAENLAVAHESPQTILIHRGACILDQSHGGVLVDEIVEEARRVS